MKKGYHHGNLRQALVDAALELIAAQGPNGFTLSEAAKQADVTPAAVYRHFAGREDLLAEVARQGYDIFAALMQFAYADGQPTALAAFEAGEFQMVLDGTLYRSHTQLDLTDSSHAVFLRLRPLVGG